MKAASCLLAAALAACGELPPPPATAPPAPATAATATASAPKLGLFADAPPQVPPATAPADPLPPLDRSFERVPLPPDTPALIGVDGQDEHDVWLLGGASAEALTLLRWDGAQATAHKGPKCSHAPDYWGLVRTPDTVIAVASYLAGEGATGRLEAHFSGRDWSCKTMNNGQLLVLAAGSLRLVPGGDLTLSGRRLPLFDLGWKGWSDVEIAARTPDDLWLYRPGAGDVTHGNGVGWEMRSPGLAVVKSLRVDETGAAWLVGGDDRNAEGNVVLRWDLAARAWVRLPAPSDLRGARVRVAGHRDVWIIGREHVHHWDGRAFQRGKTPIDGVKAAWISAAGELWLVGGDAVQKGVAFRARVPAGRQP